MDIEHGQNSHKLTHIKKLYGQCFKIAKLYEGESFPVGGTSIFSNEANIKVKGDFQRFSAFFSEARRLSQTYELKKLQEWLVNQNATITPELFATVFAFTKEFAKNYTHQKDASLSRQDFYKGMKHEPYLSDVFNAHLQECAEIAALAQNFLQEEGISSTFISGDVLWKKSEEFSEKHTFILLHDKEQTYIYDPANPIVAPNGLFPSIFTTKVDFETEIDLGKKIFITSENILTKRKVFYGVNNGTNVWPEMHIV